MHGNSNMFNDWYLYAILSFRTVPKLLVLVKKMQVSFWWLLVLQIQLEGLSLVLYLTEDGSNGCIYITFALPYADYVRDFEYYLIKLNLKD